LKLSIGENEEHGCSHEGEGERGGLSISQINVGVLVVVVRVFRVHEDDVPLLLLLNWDFAIHEQIPFIFIPKVSTVLCLLDDDSHSFIFGELEANGPWLFCRRVHFVIILFGFNFFGLPTILDSESACLLRR